MTLGPFIIEGPLLWLVAAGAAATAIAGWLVWQAVRTSTGYRRVLRVVCSLIAVGALLLMGLRPQRAVPQGDEIGLLLTEGSRADDVEQVVEALGVQPVTFVLRGVSVPDGIEAETVPDAGTLARQHPEIGTLYIMGYGLPRYELDKLPPHVRVRVGQQPIPTGIRQVWTPQTVALGNSVRVQGRIHVPDARPPIRMLLRTAGSTVDSVMIGREPSVTSEGGELQSAVFDLTSTPRAAGRTVYEIAAVDAGSDTVATGRVGVDVVEPEPVRLLVVQDAPRFETRYLKNWIADQGGSVMVRSKVSEDTYRTEFINRPRQSLATLSGDLLDSVDVTMIDRATLQALSAAERRVLRRAVEEGGLGLLLGVDVLADAGRLGPAWAWLTNVSVQRHTTSEAGEVALHWASRSDPLPPVSVSPYGFTPRFGQASIVEDGAGRTRALVQLRGQGRVGVHGALATYRWLLSGEEGAYAAYWAYLLGHVRRPLGDDQWSLDPPGPVFVDEPARLIVRTDAERPAALVQAAGGTEPDTLYMARDLHSPYRWKTTLWPRVAGWHRVQRGGGAAVSFFVQPSGAWLAVQQQRALDATNEAVYTTQQMTDGSTLESPATRAKPVPLYGVFALFVLSVGALWAEQRFRLERALASA